MELELADVILASALTSELREVCLRLMPASDAPGFRQVVSDVAEGTKDDNKAEVFLSCEETVQASTLDSSRRCRPCNTFGLKTLV
jgi:hypothetical protein